MPMLIGYGALLWRVAHKKEARGSIGIRRVLIQLTRCGPRQWHREEHSVVCAAYFVAL